MNLIFALLLVLVVVLVFYRDVHSRRLNRQAHELKCIDRDLKKCNSALESCRNDIDDFQRGVVFNRLEAELKEANDQVATLVEQLILHKAMLNTANEIADGYQNPSRTYTGISRQFGLISSSGAWSQDNVELRQKLNDRDAMIDGLRLNVQARTAEVNNLVAELMAAKYGGTRIARQRTAATMNWHGPQ